MTQFLVWFNRTAPDGAHPLPALTRAGIAHLYFVSIHPFEDGNGRIGRAISQKALAQCLGQPTLTALAATILSGYALDSRRPHTLWSATAATAPSRGHRAAVVGPIAAAHCAPRGDGSG